MSKPHSRAERTRFLIALALCVAGALLAIAGHQAELRRAMYYSDASAIFSLAGIYAMIRAVVLWK